MFRAATGMLILACTFAWAERPAWGDARRWTVVKRTPATFGDDVGTVTVVLLKSSKPTSTGGAEQPLSDVNLRILRGNKVIYDYVKVGVKPPDYNDTQFYMDDYLDIRDVTGDGIPEVLFHSGYEGTSDSVTIEHILRYDKPKASFSDIAPKAFAKSGTHGLRWLMLGGEPLVVIADRNWPASTRVEDRCHYCPGRFRYAVYHWNGERDAFVLCRCVYGRRPYTDAETAFRGDLKLIRSRLGDPESRAAGKQAKKSLIS